MAANTPRIKIDLSFAGTHFRGFQIQSREKTVQGEIESALGKIGFFPKMVGCSRTDGGVHARRFTAHCGDARPARECGEILRGLNSNLPDGIRVFSVSRVGPEFHARYSCLEKTYRYFIYLGESPPPPAAPFIEALRPAFSAGRMAEALPLFAGEHDFRAFTTTDGRRSNTVRNISSAAVLAAGPAVCIEIRGRSFLHRMVRFIAGALVCYSREKVSADFLRSALSGGEEHLPFPALPAQGLHLWDVVYGETEASEKSGEQCPLALWPFESIGLATVGRAPLQGPR